MKREWKICMPPYKMAYSLIFAILLCLVRGISDISEIGGAVDTNMALLAIVICSDTYVMEYRGKRWEIFKLFPLRSKTKAIYRRTGIQMLYLSALAYVGYCFFYWQKPAKWYNISSVRLYGMFLIAVTVTIIFWGMLSMTITDLCRNMWAGMGISIVLWVSINSKMGDELLGKFNVFAYSFCRPQQLGEWQWMWGKGIAFLTAAVMFAAVPKILKKRG